MTSSPMNELAQNQKKVGFFTSSLILLACFFIACFILAAASFLFHIHHRDVYHVLFYPVPVAFFARHYIVKAIEKRRNRPVKTIDLTQVKPIPLFHSQRENQKTKEPLDVMIKMLRKGNNPWAEDTSIQSAYSIMSEIVLKAAIKDRKEMIAGYSHDGIYQPGNETLMLALILNKLTWDVIATGRYHLYRGILNNTGKQLERLFYSTMRYIQDAGVLDENMAATWKKALRDDIAQVG